MINSTNWIQENGYCIKTKFSHTSKYTIIIRFQNLDNKENLPRQKLCKKEGKWRWNTNCFRHVCTIFAKREI